MANIALYCRYPSSQIWIDFTSDYRGRNWQAVNGVIKRNGFQLLGLGRSQRKK